MKRKFIMKTGAMLAALGIWAGAGLTLQAAITLDITGRAPVPVPTYIPQSAYIGNNGNSGLLAYLHANFSGLGELVYKQNVGGGEEGPLAQSYMTLHIPGAETPPPYERVAISYCGGLVADANYVVVKDGNAGAYIWDVGGIWNGTEILTIVNNFFTGGSSPNIQRISNVQIFGGAAVPEVPEAATIWAGAGALGLLLVGARLHPRRSAVIRIGK